MIYIIKVINDDLGEYSDEKYIVDNVFTLDEFDESEYSKSLDVKLHRIGLYRYGFCKYIFINDEFVENGPDFAFYEYGKSEEALKDYKISLRDDKINKILNG